MREIVVVFKQFTTHLLPPVSLGSFGIDAPLPRVLDVTRRDVLNSIHIAREWFEMHEPSSSVAVLLMQAERMVGKRFSQVADSIALGLLQRWDPEHVAEGGSR
ncbi:hypothetical protein J2W35_004152 [Variovorax boronicumulans]|uniref:hypothetical protein n=1 Tax=Variovorax boronicumulans TaxID=436515 RepID=UPI00278AE588|nr:hypothetical protein [Variovorax boronicumulans]MDQ0083786.1 hypothetical protein [Variovorax boronicumulans]